jgi:hypothetical protein
VPARRADSSGTVLARQKAAAESLRREVLGADGSLRHPYFRDIRRQQRSYERTATLEELFDACARAGVVYVGDFHALPACQRFAARLLEEVARRVPRVSLGIEFIYTRQQRQLDTRQAGLIEDPTFLRRIHYREEWGYPWEGFGELLDCARRIGSRVQALDVPPRGGFDGLARRDEHAARRIASVHEADPEGTLVVLYGESHVSRGHIPRRVRTLLERRGLEIDEMTVFQDPDAVYWKLLSEREQLPPAVKLSENVYAVFHGSPLAKYEAYRQVLARWWGDVPPDEEVDLTPAVHHLVGVLLGWLGIRPDRHRVRHRAGWSEDLADAFPEVYSGPEASQLLEPILEEHGRSAEEIAEAGSRLAGGGALYDSRSNALFLLQYLPGRAALEGARFLRAALSGRLFDPVEEAWEDPAARAYGAAYNEALAVLGSRLVDPTGGFPGVGEPPGSGGGAVAGGSRQASETTEGHDEWLDSHREFEASHLARPPEELLAPLRRSRPLRRALASDLGPRLGEILFERVRAGDLDARGLRHLFKRPLASQKAAQVVVHLLREKKAAPEARP